MDVLSDIFDYFCLLGDRETEEVSEGMAGGLVLIERRKRGMGGGCYPRRRRGGGRCWGDVCGEGAKFFVYPGRKANLVWHITSETNQEHARYDWTTRVPDNGNQWRKFCVVLRSLVRPLSFDKAPASDRDFGLWGPKSRKSLKTVSRGPLTAGVRKNS